MPYALLKRFFKAGEVRYIGKHRYSIPVTEYINSRGEVCRRIKAKDILEVLALEESIYNAPSSAERNHCQVIQIKTSSGEQHPKMPHLEEQCPETPQPEVQTPQTPRLEEQHPETPHTEEQCAAEMVEAVLATLTDTHDRERVRHFLEQRPALIDIALSGCARVRLRVTRNHIFTYCSFRKSR